MKKWINGISLLFCGLSIFIIGNLFHFLYVTRIIEYPEERTRDLIEKYMSSWNISAAIMTTGGIIIFIGFVIWIIKTLKLFRNKPCFKNTKLSLPAILLLVIVSFTIPIMLHFIYEPINKNILVNEFGCGCPKISGPDFSFNANTYSTIIWGSAFFVALIFWSKVLMQIENRLALLWTTLIGTTALYVLFMKFYAQTHWL